MGNVIGEEFEGYVAGQINVRQKAHGSGIDTERTIEQINYLNSKTAWVKLASGIRITEERAKANDFRGYGKTTAQNYILSGGVSRLKSINDKKLTQRSGIEDNYTGAYNVSTKDTANPNSNLEFGLVPMPGIESVEVKNMNRGSLKKATIKIKAYSREQFEIIDALYLRLGYTMMLEWGNSLYIDNEGKHKSMGYTLIDSPNGWFSKGFSSGENGSVGDKIESYRSGKDGNYDGLFSKVVNFDWSFESDGSYNITLHLISLGDVIESLKINTTPPAGVVELIKGAGNLGTATETSTEEGDLTTDGKSNPFSALLILSKLSRRANFLEKKGNRGSINTGISVASNTIKGKTGIGKFIGSFIDLKDGIRSQQRDDDPITNIDPIQPQVRAGIHGFEAAVKNLKATEAYKDSKVTEINTNQNLLWLNIPRSRNKLKKKKLQWYLYKNTKKNGEPKDKYNTWHAKLAGDPSVGTGLKKLTKEIDNVDIAFIDQNQAGGGEDGNEIISDSGFYMRFGAILSYLRDELIPTEDPSGAPQIGINSSQWGNYMTYYPNQISLDPRVCIVNASIKPVKSDTTGKTYGRLLAFPQLSTWGRESEGYAWTMNIYVSLQKLVDIMDSNINDEGDLNLFDFLSSICTELNKALGGINNLEPVIDQENNIINIIDSSFSSSTVKKPAYGLEIFGYNPKFKSSNFVRNFGLKTAITKEYANMITIGATAAGYSKGMESTAFSNWSRGYIDRFKKEIKSPNEKHNPDEAKNKYTDEFLYDEDNAYKRLGYKKETIQITPDGFWNNYTLVALNMDDAIIDDNIAIVTEYYKWLNYKTSKETKDKPKGERFTSQTNGFIPMSLNLTLDGISGIKIYNQIHVSARFLPKNYPSNLRFLVTAVNHSLNGQDWETKIETQTIPESMDGTVKASYDKLKEVMFEGTPISLLSQIAQNFSSMVFGLDDGGVITEISSYTPTSGTPLLESAVRDQFTLMYNYSKTPSPYNSRIKDNGGSGGSAEINGLCAGFSYNGILKLKEHILAKSGKPIPWTWASSGNAYEDNHLTNIEKTNGGDFYKRSYVGRLTKSEAQAYFSKQTWNYGDVVNYRKFNNSSGGEQSGFHTQVYTGDIFKNVASSYWNQPSSVRRAGNPSKGWSTSNSTNYGSSFVYSSNSTKYHVYIFKVRDKWLNISGGATPTPSGGAKGVILITGAEREKTHAQQEAIFKQGYNGTVYGYKPTNIGVEQAQAAIAKNPTFNVVLFSKGANFSKKIIDTMIAKGGNVSNFYVVEPFTPRKNDAWYGVRYGVRYKGVPPTNIQTNTYVNAGYGVLLGEDNPAGPSKYLGIPSKSKSSNHYVALTEMGRRLNS